MSRTDPRRVGVHEAKTHFSELIRAVEDGEQIVITRGGKPVARLSREVPPIRMASEAFGAYKGQFTIGPEFDEADQEIEDLFYNSEIVPLKVLLDTHTALWWFEGDRRRLSQTAFDILDAAPSADVHLSAASVWEMEIKRSVGKYSGLDLLVAARENGFSLVAVTAEHGQAAGALPPHHRDPFDRMLVIQAQMLGLPLISVDPQIALYDVTTIG